MNIIDTECESKIYPVVYVSADVKVVSSDISGMCTVKHISVCTKIAIDKAFTIIVLCHWKQGICIHVVHLIE